MLLNQNKKKTYLCALFSFLFFFLTIVVYSQNDAQLVVKGQTSIKLRAKGLGLNVGIKNVEWKEEQLEGVEIEVKKNNEAILKTTSGKKGKYSFQLPVNFSDPKSEYTVYFYKDGIGPKKISINTFISKDEFAKHSSAQYTITLDIPLVETSVKDIEIDKPFAKIKWDNVKEHKFTTDQNYDRIAMSEEQKILGNPDAYYTALAKKKKKKDEALAKNQAAAEAKLKAEEEAKKKAEEETRLKAEAAAKLKADEEAKKLAALKTKQEAERIELEKEEARKKEILKKHLADSLAEAKRKKESQPSASTTETKNVPVPVEINLDENKNRYDVSETYSINQARKAIRDEIEKRNREKGKNLTMKYETINILTSLLNAVDETDKKNKKY